MVARHYAFTLGRFLQPDAPFADQKRGNPQTWNLYPYARNNPLYFVDPTGRAGCPWNPCTAMDAQGQLGSKSGYPTMNTIPVMGSEGAGFSSTFSIVMVEVTTLNWSLISWLVTGDADALVPQDQKAIDKVAMVAMKEALGLTRADLKRGKVFEYGGWIIRSNKDGSLDYTKPVRGEENRIDLDKIPIPKGYTKVASYHTHPTRTSAEGQGAWRGDVVALRSRNIRDGVERPGYVADTYSGAVYRYTMWEPISRSPFDTREYGTPIGTIPPDKH
jgi:hypothetical protein